MLFGNEAPFPDNQVCKLCVTRPCKRLFCGRVYPGKMIAVHHSEFLSWPCHTPNLKPTQEGSGEEAALTDEIVVMTGKVTVTNPRWEHMDQGKKDNSADKAVFGDTVLLMADIKNFPDGGPVSFDIYDISMSPPQRVDTIKGSNENGVGKGEWVVTDKSGKEAGQQLAFEAIVRSKASERAPLELSELPEFHLSY